MALSPVPVAAVLIILSTPRARLAAPSFLAGWILGIGAIGLAVFFTPGLETARGEPTRLAGFLASALGAMLLVLSIRQWRSRPAHGRAVEAPELLSRLDEMHAGRVAFVGFLLSALNPKNLGFTAAGVAAIDESMLGPADQTLVFLVFVLVASASIAMPILGFLAFGERAEVRFALWKDWLIANNAAVMAVLLLVFGVLILGRGIAIVVG